MTLAIALVAGLVIGVLLGLLGGGGSILAVPVLVFALGLDIDQVPLAEGAGDLDAVPNCIFGQ